MYGQVQKNGPPGVTIRVKNKLHASFTLRVNSESVTQTTSTETVSMLVAAGELLHCTLIVIAEPRDD